MNINAYSPQIIITACVVVLVVMLLLAWAIVRQQRSSRTAKLRRRFGLEYDFALAQYGSRSLAEAELEFRLHRVERYRLRSLSATERSRFLADWDAVQARFVDHPRTAVTEAEELINGLLAARGYIGNTFSQRAADLSVNHPSLMDPYRRAKTITLRAGKGEATTEELRSAMILYRSLFDELLQANVIPMTHAEAA